MADNRFNGSLFGKLNPKRTSADGTHGGIYPLNYVQARQDGGKGWKPVLFSVKYLILCIKCNF